MNIASKSFASPKKRSISKSASSSTTRSSSIRPTFSKRIKLPLIVTPDRTSSKKSTETRSTHNKEEDDDETKKMAITLDHNNEMEEIDELENEKPQHTSFESSKSSNSEERTLHRENIRRYRMNKKLIQNGKPSVHKRMVKTKEQRKKEASERRRKNRKLQGLRQKPKTRAQVNARFKSSTGKYYACLIMLPSLIKPHPVIT